MSTETNAVESEVSNVVEMKRPPEVAGEVPQDPDILGALEPAEMATLSGLRQRSGQVTMEIGTMEVRKARLLGNLAEMEEQAQGVIQKAGARLGVKDGQQFQVLPDGRVRLMQTAKA
jgi:hypothetical protein